MLWRLDQKLRSHVAVLLRWWGPLCTEFAHEAWRRWAVTVSLRYNMEPENTGPLVKENHLPKHPFSGSMFIFGGVSNFFSSVQGGNQWTSSYCTRLLTASGEYVCTPSCDGPVVSELDAKRKLKQNDMTPSNSWNWLPTNFWDPNHLGHMVRPLPMLQDWDKLGAREKEAPEISRFKIWHLLWDFGGSAWKEAWENFAFVADVSNIRKKFSLFLIFDEVTGRAGEAGKYC